MATFRGMDGSIRFNSQVVGEIKQWSMTTDLEMLEDTVLGDAWRTFAGGLAGWQGSAEANLDYGDTLGQKAMIDRILTGTPQSTGLTLELRVSATKFFSGTALLSGVQTSAALGQIIPVTFNFQGSGALTPTWS